MTRTPPLAILMTMTLVLLASPLVSAQDRAEVAAPTERPDHETERAALRALIPIYERAATEDDIELIKPHLHEDFTAVMVTNEAVESFDDLLDYWTRIKELIGDGGSYSVKVIPTEGSLIANDLSVSRGTTKDVVVTGDGQRFEFTGRFTAVCRKVDGQWKILRIHGSIDPLGNPFVTHLMKAASLTSGLAGGAIGMAVTLVVMMLMRRRRQPAGE